MKAPRIAIPEPTSSDPGYNQLTWPEYAHAVEAAGGIAVKIPLGLPPAQVAQLAASCAGVLLPGSGADLDPEKYGHERIPECADPDPAREAVDELLMQDAANLHKPIFGICYGLQSWNVWRGGTLTQDLRTGVDHHRTRKVIEAHRVTVEPGTRLAGAAGAADLTVNSTHHQALDRVGDGMRVVARSPEDGVIEAVEGDGEHYFLGVQWHPERTFDIDPASERLFSAFIEASAAWQPRAILESVAAGRPGSEVK